MQYPYTRVLRSGTHLDKFDGLNSDNFLCLLRLFRVHPL